MLFKRMWKIQMAILLVYALGAVNAFALPTTQPRLRDRDVKIGLLTNSYLSNTRETISDEGTGNISLILGTRAVGNQGLFHFGIEAEALYGVRNAHYRYIDVGEAYAGLESKSWHVYVGRKRYEWSALDSHWGLGLYQPRFRWDYINTRENGLFGLFASFKSDLITITGFGAPIYVPEQGAPFDISGGSCKSSSPWFSCPASSISLFNQSTDIRFSLEVPPVKKLIQKQALGASVRVGKSRGFFARGSIAHKPMNQFHLSFEGNLDLSTLQIPAVIRPRVLFHTLYSLDVGFIDPKHNIVASALWERPVEDYPPTNWNIQRASNTFLSGITYKTKPFTNQLKDYRFEFSYFHRNGGNPSDKGPFISPGTNIFEPRFAFKNAMSAALFTPIVSSWADRFLFSTKFVYDSDNTGNILIADAYIKPISRTFLNFGIDILGSNSRDPVDFISRYQRNDRLRAGVSYVF
ncbi:MAG: hypothetical protein M9962_10235 [Oligoflexia bacterium]|nr:hypothetical protein [Oligoflexia bacterium]